jgi:deoxyadenosine/deoxycytidine kinase
MTTFINLFGGPGIGKSTTAAKLFANMKSEGKSVELVTEVAKDFVWENRTTTLTIQPYVTMKQYRNIARLIDKVDYVITDAPLLLGVLYGNKYNKLPESYNQLIVDLHNQMLTPSFNILLTREFAYDINGRYQDEKQAIELDNEIEDILKEYNIRYRKMTPSVAETSNKYYF